MGAEFWIGFGCGVLWLLVCYFVAHAVVQTRARPMPPSWRGETWRQHEHHEP
jgi:hypothetical protein